MDNDKIKSYTARISQANRSELLIITYELYFEYTYDARMYHASNDMVKFEESVSRAQKFVLQLLETLDYSYSLAREIYILYVFVNKMLIQAILKHKVETLDNADSVMNKLKDSFDKLRPDDHSKPLMSNVQNIYAGLTYGKNNHLMEYCDSSRIPNRGFIA